MVPLTTRPIVWLHAFLRALGHLVRGVGAILLLGVLLGVIIGLDQYRTETAIHELQQRMTPGTPLGDIILPGHGWLNLAVHQGTTGEWMNETLCMRVARKRGSADWVVRRAGGGMDRTSTVAAAQEHLLRDLASHLAGFPECRRMQVFLHQEFGFLWGVIDVEFDGNARIVAASPPRLYD
ncbi:MAG: hypothetical protein HQL84_05055 [Magnetococcales bacterium]|nr:hypothetical protein [Magnetococcales bacterium]